MCWATAGLRAVGGTSTLRRPGRLPPHSSSCAAFFTAALRGAMPAKEGSLMRNTRSSTSSTVVGAGWEWGWCVCVRAWWWWGGVVGWCKLSQGERVGTTACRASTCRLVGNAALTSAGSAPGSREAGVPGLLCPPPPHHPRRPAAAPPAARCATAATNQCPPPRPAPSQPPTSLVGRGGARGDANDQGALGQPVGGLHQLPMRQLVGHLRGRGGWVGWAGGVDGWGGWVGGGGGGGAAGPPT